MKLFKNTNFIFLILVIVIFQNCKKDQPLTEAINLSDLHFGKNLKISLVKFKKNWIIQNEDKQTVSLIYQEKQKPSNKILEKLNLIPKKTNIENSIINLGVPLELKFFAQDNKLLMLRVIRNDAPNIIEEYKNNVYTKYKLVKSLWESNNVNKGNAKKEINKENEINYQKETKLFEIYCCFLVIHFLKNINPSSVVPEQNSLEVVYFSKLNPGLNSENLIEQLKLDKE